MSIPNDLEFASTFAQQDIPVPAPVVVKVEVKKEIVDDETEVYYLKTLMNSFH